MGKIVSVEVNVNGEKAIREIKNIGNALNALNSRTSNQKVTAPLGFTNSQVSEFQRQAANLARIQEANSRTQVNNAQHASRVLTQQKLSEVRIFEAAEKSKLRQSEISAKGQVQAANNAAKSLENAKRREYQEFVRLEREKTKAAAAEARKQSSFLNNFGNKASGAGQALQGAGTGFLATVTAPLVTIGTLGTKAAISLDTVRQKFVGIEGSVEKANAKLKELQEFAFGTKGVTSEQAFATYSQLKPLKISDTAIRKQTAALGNLGQDADFSRNLLQIFQQGFERGDIKEAIGRMPLFETVLGEVAAQFGKKDAAGLKQLKESGKLTLEQFITGFADAVNNNPNFAKAGESISVKLQKSLERLNASLVPLGEVILRSVLPVLEQIAPYIQRAGEYFASLSPQVQLTVIAIGAFATALAPALVLIGSAVSAVGGLVTAFSAISGAVAAAGGIAGLAPIIAGVVLAVGALGAAAYAAYQAWTTNFGNLQGSVAVFQAQVTEAFNSLITVIQPAIDAVSQYAVEGFNSIKGWWATNGQAISQAAETVFASILKNVQITIDLIRKIWADHGEQITEIATSAWNIIKTIISATATQIGNAILLVTNVINGNWAGAWENFKSILAGAVNGAGTILKSLINVVYQVLKAVVVRMVNIGTEFLTTAYNIGKNIVQGLTNGIGDLATTVYDKAKSVAQTALSMISGVFQTQSPSKATFEIGQYFSEGLALGIESAGVKATAAAKKVASEVVKQLQDAVKEFNKLAGASPQTVATIQNTNRTQAATSSQQEIIKLRGELGVDLSKPMPSGIPDTELQLADLERLKKKGDEWAETLERIGEQAKETRDQVREDRNAFDDRIKAIEQSGAANVLNLQKEIDLMGVTDEMEKQRIENAYDLLSLRDDLINQGFGEQQVNEILQVQKAEGARLLELQKIKVEREKYIEAVEKQKEAEKRAIEETKRQYEELKGTIADVFDIVSDSGASVGEKLTNVFRYVTDRFKRMMSDIVSEFLASKVFGSMGGGTSSGGGGFNLGSILGGLFGGGNRPTPTGGFAGGTLDDLFRNMSGGSSSSGVGRGGAWGGWQQIANDRDKLAAQLGGTGGFKFGNNAATYGIVGMGANFLGSAIGGRWGGAISGAGSGLAMGAQIGSIVPGIGTAIGAGVGAAVGFFAGLLGGNKKEKEDKKNFPEFQKGFAEAIAQMQAILTDLQKPRVTVDVESAVKQAESIRKQIESTNVGQIFQSSKYRKQGQSQIKSYLSQADTVLSQINAAAGAARTKQQRRDAASELYSRILPEFADGGSVSQFAKFNNLFSGRVPGAYDRRDDKLIRVSGDEVVLTPKHWRPITPYLAQAKVPGFADGGFVGSMTAPVTAPVVNVQMGNIILEGFTAAPDAKAYLETPDGKRSVISIVEDGFANGKVRLQKR